MGEDGEHTLDISFSDPDMRPVLDPIHHTFEIHMGELPSHAHMLTHHFLGFELHRPPVNTTSSCASTERLEVEFRSASTSCNSRRPEALQPTAKGK